MIVGKRALAAMDLGAGFLARLPVSLRPDDMVFGFDFSGDDEIRQALELARSRGALTVALAGTEAEYSFEPPTGDPFLDQEIFEVLYHLLWESVHVYFEHREQGHDVGASSFLYPFLGSDVQGLDEVAGAVQSSMLQKSRELNAIRTEAANREAEGLSAIAEVIAVRLGAGRKLIAFGNGGSATDANDLALDFVSPPASMMALPALSLSSEPATITAIANDVGAEAIFVRQMIAHGERGDVAVGISTSGSSPNILGALSQARKQGLVTIGIAGYDGGRLLTENFADHTLVVHCDYIPRIQEAQASLYHVLRRRVAELLDGGEPDA